MLIQIGDTTLYEAALNSTYDALLNSELDVLLNSELADVYGHKWLSAEGLQIDHYTGGRATCSFVVWDESGAYTFFERQKVLVTDNNLDPTEGFAGIVQRCTTTKMPNSTKKFHYIEAADFTAILDWRIIDYAAEDKLAGDAVREILSEYLQEEGISEGYIEDGNLMTEISISNKSASSGIAKLAEACGFIYYISYDLKLYFHSRTLYAADWNIIDGSDILADTWKVNRANENYRNTEVVVGGFEETALQEETIATDGVTKSFALGYPVNRVVSVTVNGVEQTIGVKGYDSGGGFDVYFANKSETVTFEEPPEAGTCVIQYYGLWRAKSKAEDLTAIEENKSRQGVGSGKVEHLTIDESLTSIVAAGEYANAKLAEYGVDGIQISYQTRRAGLAAGTLQHIAFDGLDHDMLIYHVGVTYQDGDVVYSVEGCYGPVQEDWENFLNQSFQLIYTVREGVEEATGVTKLYNFSHTFYVEGLEDGDPNPFVKADPGATYVDDLTWPCFDPEDRALYIEFWNDGECIFRKRHTSTPDMSENDLFHSYSFISPSEGLGQIDEIVFWGGDSASLDFGSGVELFRANFSHIKTILESLQINATYINGDT